MTSCVLNSNEPYIIKLGDIEFIHYVLKEMWFNHEKCEDPYKKVEILTQIVNAQPFLTKYFENSKNGLC